MTQYLDRVAQISISPAVRWQKDRWANALLHFLKRFK